MPIWPAQRLRVDSILYTFSEAVNIASTMPSRLLSTMGRPARLPPWAGPRWVSQYRWLPARRCIITFSGAGVIANSIADGVYDLTINSAAVTSDQNPAIAMQSRATDVFYRLFADVNGDGRVSEADYNAFLSTNGLHTADVGFIAGLDANGDGRISGADYNAFLFSNGNRLNGFTATLIG